MYHNNVTNLIHFHFHTLLCRNPLHVSGVKSPSSGGTTLAVFGVCCVHLYMLAGCKFWVNWYIALGGVGVGPVAW
jgi:hypothetical protein